MENRELVIEDYFKLRLLLNRTNRIRNQRTDLDFIAIKKGFSNYSLVATLTGVQNPKHIELCTKVAGTPWRSADFSGLIYIEDFCATFLRRKLSQYFSFDELNIAVTILKSELQSLGISR